MFQDAPFGFVMAGTLGVGLLVLGAAMLVGSFQAGGGIRGLLKALATAASFLIGAYLALSGFWMTVAMVVLSYQSFVRWLHG